MPYLYIMHTKYAEIVFIHTKNCINVGEAQLGRAFGLYANFWSKNPKGRGFKSHHPYRMEKKLALLQYIRKSGLPGFCLLATELYSDGSHDTIATPTLVDLLADDKYIRL